MPQIFAEVNVEFEVYCDKCGKGICRNTTTKGNSIYVSPCLACLETEKNEGHAEGYDEGHAEGYKEGHVEGYDEGLKAGLEQE